VGDGAVEVGLIKWGELGSAAVDTAADLEAIIARGQRPRLLPHEAVEVAPVGVLDEDDVAEAAIGDEGDPGPLSLDERVGGDGRAMDEELDVRCRNARLLDDAKDRLDRLLRHARRFVDSDLACLGVECHEIGEGTADIDRNLIGHALPAFLPERFRHPSHHLRIRTATGRCYRSQPLSGNAAEQL